MTTDLLMLFFFQAEDGIRYRNVTGVQTCALPILERLDSVEEPEQEEPGDERGKREREREHRERHPRHLVDDDRSRVFPAEDTLGPMRRPRAGERDDHEEDDQTGTREGHEPEDEHGEGAADGAGSDGYPPRAAGRGDDQRDAVRGSDAARRAR